MSDWPEQEWEDEHAYPTVEVEREDESLPLDEIYRYPEDASPEERADWLESMLEERARRRATRPIDFYEPLEAFEPFHEDEWSKERWVIGGNRSGKTTATMAEVALLVTGHSTWWDGPPHEVWIVSVKTAKSIEVCRPLIRALLPPGMIGPESLRRWRHEKTERESVLQLPPDPRWPNHKGWTIRFKACDQGRQAFESGSVALVVFDEEPTPDVYTECYTRTVDCGGRIVVGFTPLNGIAWKDAYETVYLPWERMLQEAEAEGRTISHGCISEDAKISVFTAGMLGNPTNTPEQIELYKARYATQPLQLRVRLYGHWIETAEDAIIDITNLHDYESWPAPPEGVSFKTVVGWIDARYSDKKTQCEGAIAIASLGSDGNRYLRELHAGKWTVDRQLQLCVAILVAYGCPRTFVQNEGGDVMFMRLLNRELRDADGGRACVTAWPEKGNTPSKTIRANELQPLVQAGQVFYSRTAHAQFRQEAGVFSTAYQKAGGLCDAFDASMGAIMMCERGTVSDLLDANERARKWVEEEKEPASGRADRLHRKAKKKGRGRYLKKPD